MKRKMSLHQAFQDLAAENVPQRQEPWLQIAREIQQRADRRTSNSRRITRIIIAVLGVFLAGATVVYAYNRLMIDPGLQDADQNGLVSNFNQTAAPTVFNQVPAELAAAPLASASENGITVTLDWAYMDESRLALQLSLSGLSVPQGQNFGDFVCKPYLTDVQNVALGSSYLTQVSQTQPGQPYELVYVFYQHVDAAKNEALDFNLDLTLGPCGPWWNFGEVYTGPGPTPTPPPLIGNYHLSFSVPVYQGTTIHPALESTSNAITMRLQAVTFTPSYTEAEFCYPHPGPDGSEWTPEEITMQVDSGAAVPSNGGFAVQQEDGALQGQYCFVLGFGVAVKPGSSLTFRVVNLQSFDGLDTLLRSADLQQTLAANLAKEGIIIDFSQAEGSQFWKVLQKPVGMTTADVEAKVWAFLTHRIHAEWSFKVSNTP